MMSDAHRREIVDIIVAAKRATDPVDRNLCWSCGRHIESCSCGLADLRAAVARYMAKQEDRGTT